MIWKDVTISCDFVIEEKRGYNAPEITRCRAKITLSTDNRTEARQLAREEGWRYRKGPRDYCPTHKDTK